MSMLLVFSSVALVSCAMPVANEASPYYRLPVGTTVVLHQDLAVPAGHARVFLQGGKTVAQHRLKSYYPSCNFEQRHVSDGHAVIKADRFQIKGVDAGDDYVVQSSSLVTASWRVVGNSDSVSMVNPYVRYGLSSQRQPQVMRLTCHGGFDLQGRAQPPSLTQMRDALGSVATIEVPER